VEVSLHRFAETDEHTFHQTLLRCHEDSLDCPEMQDLRTADELLAGYCDCAPDESQWWLAEVNGEPAGVLILADTELIFVGVVPQRRGQGIGRAIVATSCEKSSELSLVVDVRNAPAVQLYLSLGFEVIGAREVFLKSPPGQHSPKERKSSNLDG
jgi:ribosomal protein S18 acetylase RimI-like enzyme